MRLELMPAIEALTAEVAECEMRAETARMMTNRMCELAGVPPIYGKIINPVRSISANKPALIRITAGQFREKSLRSAVTEYFQTSEAIGRGASTVAEICVALVQGGYPFSSSLERNQLKSVRKMLQRNLSIFRRLPDGKYQLLPEPLKGGAMPAQNAPDRAKTRDLELKRTGAQSGRTNSDISRAGSKASPSLYPSLAPFVLSVMSDGADWTPNRLKHEAISRGVPGISEATKISVFQGTMLGCKARSQVEFIGKGTWRIIKDIVEQS